MIKEQEKALFQAHALRCCDHDGGSHEICDADHLLRFWTQNKSQYLYKLLGNQLILSKDMVYERPRREIIHELDRFISQQGSFVRKFRDALEETIHPMWETWCDPLSCTNDAARFFEIFCDCLDPSTLYTGRVSDRATTRSQVVNGHTITFSPGMKLMKALGKIAEALNLSNEFEQFRIGHSQILNQKQLHGKINLSIHPLDYATASDNVNDWSSCMSWETDGCYRLGTVEMMNSPMVICAYMTGKNEMEVGGQDTYGMWNSKKWRTWIIVTKDLAMVNRQYPFDNDQICLSLLKWVRELAKENLGWNYDEPKDSLNYEDYGYEFHTNFMYNDICGEGYPGMFRTGLLLDDPLRCSHTTINFSGPAVCMYCGEEIVCENSEEANTLVCPSCRALSRCCYCDEYINSDDLCWTLDDQPCCCECYNEHYVNCDNCDELCYSEDTEYLQICLDENVFKQYAEDNPETKYAKYLQDFPGSISRNYSTVICHDCLRRLTGKSGEEALLYECEMPYPYYRSYFSSSFSTVNTVNPLEVSMETANEIFGFYREYLDTDGSFKAVFEKAYEAHIKRLETHGCIEID